ncbi:hypothetical protein NBRC116583_34860 [Arenicella sp. 4NH20-0111]|uniref:hypothetical protein n=1 Tax=Arenicella sp. 4NH20-0111 TaxID=3127648 RepID=UPI003107934D
MIFQELVSRFEVENGVEQSTMMGTPCLRYKGEFIGMMFDKEDSLIIKVSSERVDEIIANGEGNEFNFTKKRFKEWVLIPLEFREDYEAYLGEALTYAKTKKAE